MVEKSKNFVPIAPPNAAFNADFLSSGKQYQDFQSGSKAPPEPALEKLEKISEEFNDEMVGFVETPTSSIVLDTAPKPSKSVAEVAEEYMDTLKGYTRTAREAVSIPLIIQFFFALGLIMLVSHLMFWDAAHMTKPAGVVEMQTTNYVPVTEVEVFETTTFIPSVQATCPNNGEQMLKSMIYSNMSPNPYLHETTKEESFVDEDLDGITILQFSKQYTMNV